MTGFRIRIQDSTHTQDIDAATSFVGEDASGSFGIKAGHARMMASLTFGLARFCTAGGQWQYIAMPGAIVYFANDLLTINTRRFVASDDYERVQQALVETLAAEEQQLSAMKRNLRDIESQIMRRLLRARRGD